MPVLPERSGGNLVELGTGPAKTRVMRTISSILSIAVALGAGTALGCSSRTQQNAKETTSSAAEDVEEGSENAADETGEAVEEGAEETGEAVEEAGDEVEEATDKEGAD